MPAHRAEAPQTAQPPVPLAGVLLILVAIVTICLLATTAGSSIEPAGGTPMGSAPTVALTPDDPGAASPVPVQVLER